MRSTASTFETLQALILSSFKRTDKITEIKAAINATHREMVAALGWRKAEDQIYKTLVPGREEYPVPDLVLRINHPVRIIEPGSQNNSSGNHPLTFMTKDEYDEYQAAPNQPAALIQKGKPWGYTFFKNSLLFTDIPDRAYIIEANIGGEAAELVNPGDQVIFAPTFDETIKAGALCRLYTDLRMLETAAVHQSIYRWGYAGAEWSINGGLELLRKLNKAVERAPYIVQPGDF